jgi:hypothetical protein
VARPAVAKDEKRRCFRNSYIVYVVSLVKHFCFTKESCLVSLQERERMHRGRVVS